MEIQGSEIQNIQEETPDSAQRTKIYDSVKTEVNRAGSELQISISAGTETSTLVEKWQIALRVWFVGAILLGSYVIVQNYRLWRRVQKMPVKDQVNGIEVRVGREVLVPCLVGVRKSKIVMPEKVFENTTLYDHAVQHELAHACQKDPVWNLIKILLCMVYWWNPLVWLAAKCAEEDAELACDARVLKDQSLEIRKAYGYALLQMIEQVQEKNSPLIVATSMSGNKKSMKRRIEAISHRTSTKRYVAFPVLFLLSGVLALGCGTPTEKSEIGSATEENDQYEQDEYDDAEEESAGQYTDCETLTAAWAEAFVSRDADTIAGMTTEAAYGQLIDAGLMEEGEGFRYFGWSSPWPMFGNEQYEILQCNDLGAEILYYTTISTPHVYVWKETLRFEQREEGLLVKSEELTMYDEIQSFEAYLEAYPEGKISGTMMDYSVNGLGEVLNQNALEQPNDEVYHLLFDPVTAAYELLNISKDENVTVYSVEDSKGTANVQIHILKEGKVTDTIEITMWQPYGEDGIWIPK